MDNNIIDKHTKGKWEVKKSESNPSYNVVGERLEAEANAAFIVKACNEYSSLVEQNKMLLEALKGICNCCYDSEIFTTTKQYFAAKEAIKKCQP